MRQSKIPSSIKVGNKKIKVVQKDLDGKLGCLNTISNTIFIEKNQPEVGKIIILIHELIHLADLMNVQAKVYKRRLTEAQVESTAGVLSLILVSNKIVCGYSQKEINELLK
jgi:hypothetical protein